MRIFWLCLTDYGGDGNNGEAFDSEESYRRYGRVNENNFYQVGCGVRCAAAIQGEGCRYPVTLAINIIYELLYKADQGYIAGRAILYPLCTTTLLTITIALVQGVSLITALTEKLWERRVGTGDDVWIVEFYAPW